MPQSSRPAPADQRFLDLVHAIISGNDGTVADLVDTSPALVLEQAAVGATRNGPDNYFFEAIAHYMYAGDTALHMAAASFQHGIVQTLIDRGADCSARNRRGAQPLHYAADSNVWKPAAQAATIDRLIQAGADPNATDKSGVPPLHRAVRTRCAAAVEALLAGGAEPRGRNKHGSAPLHLAVQNTGRGDSGTPRAREQQRQIIELLLNAGARPDDEDENGKTVRDAAKAGWIHALLQG
jgi:ankyrin repeat protein